MALLYIVSSVCCRHPSGRMQVHQLSRESLWYHNGQLQLLLLPLVKTLMQVMSDELKTQLHHLQQS